MTCELNERSVEFQSPAASRHVPGATPSTGSMQVVVSNTTPETAQLRDVLFRLRFTMLDLTEIYQSACTPYYLWNLALFIIQFSQLDDASRVAKLWKSIIYRYLLS